MNEEHFAGFISVLGYPNAGKSSLSNLLIGENLSIITEKSQTTRHSIQGFLNGENYQMIFCDTPGILEPSYKLQESMMTFVYESLEECDIVLAVWDVTSNESKEEFLKFINKSAAPKILVLNKIDLISDEQLTTEMENWRKLDVFTEIVPTSALRRKHMDILLAVLKNNLPAHPPYFPKDQLTNRSERFFASEMIREKVLKLYYREVPYSVEVVVESFKEEEDILRIQANILVERDSQKGIIIGKGGRDLKRLGMQSRQTMEKFFQKKIFLDLSVKVRENWRNDNNWLKKFGYNN
jgi:GTP-binding protein Era